MRPFLIGPRQNATFADSVDHSHGGMARKLDVKDGIARMDGFAADEYGRYANGTPAGEARARQFARLVMSYVDCETIPSWRWASRFTIFDNVFATEDGPSSPNAVAMLSGQAGEFQWVEHGARGQAFAAVAPVCGVSYPDGAPGPRRCSATPSRFSARNSIVRRRTARRRVAREYYGSTNIMADLTFASLPLSLLGEAAGQATGADLDKPRDLPGVRQDIDFLSRSGETPVSWRWYQEGYDREPTDTGPTASHRSYVSHHNGAQYFGYIANNPKMNANLKGLGDFFDDVVKGQLPEGGVIYIRGGYENIARGCRRRSRTRISPRRSPQPIFPRSAPPRRATTIIRVMPTARSARP